MEAASETHATSCRALTVVIGITPNEAGDGAVVNIAENTNYRQCLYMGNFAQRLEKVRFSRRTERNCPERYAFQGSIGRFCLSQLIELCRQHSKIHVLAIACRQAIGLNTI